MAENDAVKIPVFRRAKKLKPYIPVPTVVQNVYAELTDEQIESCRRGQDIFDFARDIERIVRSNNNL